MKPTGRFVACTCTSANGNERGYNVWPLFFLCIVHHFVPCVDDTILYQMKMTRACRRDEWYLRVVCILPLVKCTNFSAFSVQYNPNAARDRPR
jgi:hypothetical protein